MVEGRLRLESEVQDIFKYIDQGKNFILSGGAGSGKTYSLVSIIRQIIEEHPTVKVACMTFTNAAVKEIEGRVNHKNLNVSTIHDFLWDNIKHFQKELKAAIISLANNDKVSRISIRDMDIVPDGFYDELPDGIQYKEYVRLREGIISHDELLIIANYLFCHCPKLCSIVKDKYKFIFIDEYQDTNKYVVDIFLTHFNNSKKKSIIGFFGDSMQSIYDDGIGDLNNYLGDNLVEVQKTQNRRNPQRVIDLANKLRTDGIVQEPSSDLNAPNMNNGIIKDGTVLFFYSIDNNLDILKTILSNEYDWDFNNSKETKDLNLTHNLIANRGGFKSLMDIYDKDQILKFRDKIKKHIKDKAIEDDFSEKTFGEVIDILQYGKSDKELKAVNPAPKMQEFIDKNPDLFDYAKSLNYTDIAKLYVDKEQLLDDKKQDAEEENKKGSKRSIFIKHLCKIQYTINLYKEKKYNEFFRVVDNSYKITSIEDKRILKANIDSLIDVGNMTIEEVINSADEKKICLIDDNLIEFKKKNEYLYNRIKTVLFSEFQNIYDYLEGKTPFSTQHKTKGTEFDNVLVVLDNGKWNNYNFGNVFLNTGSSSVLKRTQKLFYVCCTRAKENLAVFYHSPTPELLVVAKEWFGEENVINIDNIQL